MEESTHMLEVGLMEQILRIYPENSCDSIVTDPPYGFKFMGKSWDYQVPSVEQWRAAYRVLKPGGYLVSFGGSRTFHRMAVNIEDAGFEIRDTIMWLYSQGFPKSMDVSKAIDKAKGAERNVIGKVNARMPQAQAKGWGNAGVDNFRDSKKGTKELNITTASTDLAKEWEGWGTALKPAYEPIIIARKPLDGTVSENIEKWGVGAINIGESRIPGEPWTFGTQTDIRGGNFNTNRPSDGNVLAKNVTGGESGRWPANVIHDGSDEVLNLMPNSKSGKPGTRRKKHETNAMAGRLNRTGEVETGYGDSGSAARFFYCAKATRKDREEGLEDFEKQPLLWSSGTQNPGSFQAEGTDRSARNNHPTVKPTALMEYLCKLVTPSGGLILDPFMGSGSTGKACVPLGYLFLGIDMDEKWIPIAEARIKKAYEAHSKAA